MGQRRAWLLGLMALSPFAAGVGPLGPAHTVCASGCDYTQIQPALDASANGDRVFVHPDAHTVWAGPSGPTPTANGDNANRPINRARR